VSRTDEGRGSEVGAWVSSSSLAGERAEGNARKRL
jgi:hypothetical protein